MTALLDTITLVQIHNRRGEDSFYAVRDATPEAVLDCLYEWVQDRVEDYEKVCRDSLDRKPKRILRYKSHRKAVDEYFNAMCEVGDEWYDVFPVELR